MVTIRCARRGNKKRPFYHVVVADHRTARNGRFLEKLGTYNPLGESALEINQERAAHWLSQGAQLSSKVAELFKRAGITKQQAAA